MVSERLWSSSMSDWHDTLHGGVLALLRHHHGAAERWTPPPLEMPFVSVADVSGAASTTLQPVSRFWPAPANVMPVKLESALAAVQHAHGVEVAHMAAESCR